jgi:hypothetical protein
MKQPRTAAASGPLVERLFEERMFDFYLIEAQKPTPFAPVFD